MEDAATLNALLSSDIAHRGALITLVTEPFGRFTQQASARRVFHAIDTILPLDWFHSQNP